MTPTALTFRPETRPAPPPRARDYPPPTGPRLDPTRPPAGAVDWWGWQARVRAAIGSARVSVRPARVGVRSRRWAVAALVGVGVLVAGGAVVVGRGVRATPVAAADPAAVVGPASGSTTVSATPLELVGVSDLPPPPPPPPAQAPVVEEAQLPAPVPVRASYPVTRTTVDLVDPARPTVARGDAAAADGRLLRTVLRVPDAPGAGPFPLVVFAHGYATSTAAYGPLLDELAAAGYVVAAPELPVTSTALGPDVGEREPAAQVDDLRFVISAVQLLAAGDGPLRGAVREGPVAVIGHSDGGMSAAAVAFSGASRDDRVGAAVVLSGARIADGSPWFPAGGPALLAVHGDADTVNPFGASQSLFAADRSGSARYLVRVRGGGHTDAFVSARTRPALVALVDDFLRASVVGDGEAAARIPTDAAASGVLELLGA